jgi:hypothetical protein
MTTHRRDGKNYVLDGSGAMFADWLDCIARTDYRCMYDSGYDPKKDLNAEADILLLLSELASAMLSLKRRKDLFQQHQGDLLRLFGRNSVNTTIPADCRIMGWAMLEGIRLSQSAEWTGQFGDDEASRKQVVQARRKAAGDQDRARACVLS